MNKDINEEISRCIIKMLLKEPFYAHFLSGVIREITDQVFEFFMGLPAYKKAADKTKMSTTQAQMLVDLQKALDEKISKIL